MTSALDTLIESYTSTTGVYWALEDVSGTTAAADLSGNGHTLSCSSFTFGTAGIIPSDSLTCAKANDGNATNTSYTPSLTAVTLGFAVNFPTLPASGTFPGILASLSGHIGTEAFVTGSTGILQFDIANGTSTFNAIQTSPLVAAHSYLAILTWNGTTVTFYLYDLTANEASEPVSGSLAGGTFSPPSGGWDISDFSLSADIGRYFVLPLSLTSTEVLGVATAAGYVAPPPFVANGLLGMLI